MFDLVDRVDVVIVCVSILLSLTIVEILLLLLMSADRDPCRIDDPIIQWDCKLRFFSSLYSKAPMAYCFPLLLEDRRLVRQAIAYSTSSSQLRSRAQDEGDCTLLAAFAPPPC